jgi:protein-tyrosine phosphatase
MKNLLILIFTLFSQVSYSQDTTLVFSPKRQIKLEGGSNFRDLGGYPTTEGKIVKWGHIYRSADVSKLTDNDLKTLSDLHLATVCDFRGPDELKTNPDRLPAGIQYINLPAGSENTKTSMNYASMNRDSMMLSFYTKTDHLKAKYKPMFEQLLALPNDKSLMFHCTAGKDRTGMGAALVLSALGVDRKYIAADYAATNIFWKDAREKMLTGMAQRGMDSSALKPMLAADPKYLEYFLNTIDSHYGSMDTFLKAEMELDAEKIAKLKGLYLE